jgi:electron transport complex protein RnfG
MSAQEKWLKEHYDKFTVMDKWSQNENVNQNIIKSFLIEKNGSRKLVQFLEVQGSIDFISLVTVIQMDEGIIEGIYIIEENETPDYGGYIKEDWYLGRYIGKSIDNTLKTVVMMDKHPNEVVAITGATESSDAITTAVNYSIENIHYLQLKKGES